MRHLRLITNILKKFTFYKLKADLEDRSRRNNIKFRGIPEAVKPPDLTHYIQQLFFNSSPNCNLIEPTGSLNLTICQNQWRKMCWCALTFFKSKRRSWPPLAPLLSWQIPTLLFLSTLTSPLLPLRKGESSTKSPHFSGDRNIAYKWGFPAKLMVNFQNQAINIYTLPRKASNGC